MALVRKTPGRNTNRKKSIRFNLFFQGTLILCEEQIVSLWSHMSNFYSSFFPCLCGGENASCCLPVLKSVISFVIRRLNIHFLASNKIKKIKKWLLSHTANDLSKKGYHIVLSNNNPLRFQTSVCVNINLSLLITFAQTFFSTSVAAEEK